MVFSVPYETKQILNLQPLGMTHSEAITRMMMGVDCALQFYFTIRAHTAV